MHKTTHAVMFHHFHNDIHPKGQGSISKDEFEKILDWLAKHYRVLSAESYLKKAVEGELRPTEICLTFDDALLCQFDLALPVLKERGIGAFFFIYSSPMKGNPVYLEIFRHFRTVEYSIIDMFYKDFFHLCKRLYSNLYESAEESFDSKTYLSSFPFYTEHDKWYRCLRDDILGEKKHDKIMFEMMSEKNYNIKRQANKLWMSDKHISDIIKNGHIVGLHSYSHPTNFDRLVYHKQLEELFKNYYHLYDIKTEPIQAISYPCGRYNEDTLNILNAMGIKIGFCSSMENRTMKSILEIPREDHANIIKEISK